MVIFLFASFCINMFKEPHGKNTEFHLKSFYMGPCLLVG